MPLDRKLFALVVWLGVLANWVFSVIVVFVDPHPLLARLDLGPVESTVWIYNYSILLMILSLFYIPAAHDPFRYRANAWLLVVGRLVPASSFFLGVAMGFMPSGFVTLGIGDATIGIIELILLLRIYSAERLVRPAMA